MQFISRLVLGRDCRCRRLRILLIIFFFLSFPFRNLLCALLSKQASTLTACITVTHNRGAVWGGSVCASICAAGWLSKQAPRSSGAKQLIGSCYSALYRCLCNTREGEGGGAPPVDDCNSRSLFVVIYLNVFFCLQRYSFYAEIRFCVAISLRFH